MPWVVFETLIPLTPNHSWVIEMFREYESRVSDDAPALEDDVISRIAQGEFFLAVS